MDIDDAITGGVEVAEHAITEIARADSNWAAIILVVVVFGMIAIAMLVVWFVMGERVKRANARAEREEQRTNEEKAAAEERMMQIKQAHERDLHFRDSLNSRYDDTLNKVNMTLGSVNEAWRQSNQIHEGTRIALDKNSALLERFVPPPPRPSRRKQAEDEQANLRNP